MQDEDLHPIKTAKLDQSLDKIAAIGQLLTNYRWAKIWFNMDLICRPGEGVTAQDVIDATDIPQSTVYEDLDDMSEIGCVEVQTEGRPRKYTPVSVNVFVSEQPREFGKEYHIDPILIGVVGEAYEDEDVSLFLSRNSYTVLEYLISQVLESCFEGDGDCSLAEYLGESAPIDEVDLNLIETPIHRILIEQVQNNPDFDLAIPEE
jgi:hypothetical protein